ncbi:hypothetical protein CU098_004342, partial [Rhizopus stolonifer]
MWFKSANHYLNNEYHHKKQHREMKRELYRKRRPNSMYYPNSFEPFHDVNYKRPTFYGPSYYPQYNPPYREDPRNLYHLNPYYPYYG